MNHKIINYLFILILVSMGACTSEKINYVEDSSFSEICKNLRTNKAFPLSDTSDDWFQVYESYEGVYSIVEPYQFQMSISHLIIGTDKALLFDTGMGILPIKPIVERITNLPITVLNSHTHFDHVGGNAEFSEILAIDSLYTKSNMQGFKHEEVAGDVALEAFCGEAPIGLNTGTYHTRSWSANEYVSDGQKIDLGGRILEVMHVPGHTPDAVALLDAKNGLLFTGDTFYDDNLWLFSPETNLDDYSNTIDRLVQVENKIQYLFGAHTTARVDAGRLALVKTSLQKLRSGSEKPVKEIGERQIYQIDGINFVTSKAALEGKQIDIKKGASGL
tara:strand:- start:184 stop:1179 length:996 start_codon:yes stop_codon:yes gene_type:complete